MDTNRPIIGITMGEPCGIGAEVIVKALTCEPLRRRGRFAIFGFSEQLTYMADALETNFQFRREHHEDIRRFGDEMVVLDYDEMSLPVVMPRGPSRLGGKASMAFCEDAIAAAQGGLIDAIVTAPISKTSWQIAGYRKYPGHTELLAEKCKVKHYAMMFIAPQLRVALATIHTSLMNIRDKFTIGCVFNPIDLA
ncbi:MAG: 4-hydroxythreonine-4-phosphate dehydrogenase PdxA, partial [Phycisphaerae bacterium]|nr:4-hydroxythreonine-4-phosphate dehydrogenase PdxA [Phycisphaerae bacterium]